MVGLWSCQAKVKGKGHLDKDEGERGAGLWDGWGSGRSQKDPASECELKTSHSERGILRPHV